MRVLPGIIDEAAPEPSLRSLGRGGLVLLACLALLLVFYFAGRSLGLVSFVRYHQGIECWFGVTGIEENILDFAPPVWLGKGDALRADFAVTTHSGKVRFRVYPTLMPLKELDAAELLVGSTQQGSVLDHISSHPRC